MHYHLPPDIRLYLWYPWQAKCTPCPIDLKDECPTKGGSGNYKNFQCLPGYCNDPASLFLNTSDDAIRNLFSHGTQKEFQPSTLVIFLVAVYCMPWHYYLWHCCSLWAIYTCQTCWSLLWSNCSDSSWLFVKQQDLRIEY